jgi:hypothetical protein
VKPLIVKEPETKILTKRISLTKSYLKSGEASLPQEKDMSDEIVKAHVAAISQSI